MIPHLSSEYEDDKKTTALPDTAESRREKEEVPLSVPSSSLNSLLSSTSVPSALSAVSSPTSPLARTRSLMKNLSASNLDQDLRPSLEKLSLHSEDSVKAKKMARPSSHRTESPDLSPRSLAVKKENKIDIQTVPTDYLIPHATNQALSCWDHFKNYKTCFMKHADTDPECCDGLLRTAIQLCPSYQLEDWRDEFNKEMEQIRVNLERRPSIEAASASAQPQALVASTSSTSNKKEDTTLALYHGAVDEDRANILG